MIHETLSTVPGAQEVLSTWDNNIGTNNKELIWHWK